MKDHDSILCGGIEAGGTKFVCAVGTGPDDVRAEARFATTEPGETIARAVGFFREHAEREPLAAVGIASFGPVDPDPSSHRFGHILATPKPGWADVDLAGTIGQALGVPVGFDTDVNGAALGENRWGAARGLDTFLYITVGTGIGGGGMIAGQLMHGLLHPEMGHILIPRRADDPFAGRCPFHGACLEGMAAGPALNERWGASGQALPDDHPAWDLEAYYLALGICNFILVLSPQRIILGGGVMNNGALFPAIRSKVQALLGGYVTSPAILHRIDEYIVPPGLGARAGVLGAIALGQRAAAGADRRATRDEAARS